MATASFMVSINNENDCFIIILSGVIDNLLHNESIVEDVNGIWEEQLKEMKIWENIQNLPIYLRKRWVKGAKEWLSGLHGWKENDGE